jgi:superfamily II DNA or RNA helicase
MTSLPFTDRFIFRPPQNLKPRVWHTECLAEFRARVQSPPVGQLTFLVSAGVGSGKTYLAALIAAEALNTGLVRRVVYVCPNRAIKRAVRQTFSAFDIFLTDWSNRRHAQDGEGVFSQGAILTYQSLARRPEVQARRHRTPTLVIFDEIHHLGDKQTWDVAARAAFAHPSTVVLGLSGTPFRADNRSIPFVDTYFTDDGLLSFRPNYPYPLGRAILDGVCRRPQFHWLGAEVDVTTNGHSHRHVLDDQVQDDLATLLLSGAVKHGSGSRLDALKEAVRVCTAEQRKLIIFVGGDSGAIDLATNDAETLLPAELQSIGVPAADIVSVTSASPDAVEKLHSFGKSPARILVTVNMVSEGVDIPEVSAALFLTSITAKATTIQRIGRALRGNRPAVALVFMFRDPRYRELAQEIEDEINHEIDLRRTPPERTETEPGEGRARRPEATGLCAWENGLTVNGHTYSAAQVTAARARMVAERLPDTEAYLGMVLQFLYREPRP